MSHIECKSPSLCAVPGQAYIHLDRRLTTGDTKKSAVAEVKDAIKRAEVKADVEVLTYEVPSYTGLVYKTEKYFPTWCEDEDSIQVQAAIKTHRDILGTPAPSTAGPSAPTAFRSPACTASPASASAPRPKASPTPSTTACRSNTS